MNFQTVLTIMYRVLGVLDSVKIRRYVIRKKLNYCVVKNSKLAPPLEIIFTSPPPPPFIIIKWYYILSNSNFLLFAFLFNFHFISLPILALHHYTLHLQLYFSFLPFLHHSFLPCYPFTWLSFQSFTPYFSLLFFHIMHLYFYSFHFFSFLPFIYWFPFPSIYSFTFALFYFFSVLNHPLFVLYLECWFFYLFCSKLVWQRTVVNWPIVILISIPQW